MKKPKELNVVTVDRTEKENNTTTRYKQCSLRPISNKKNGAIHEKIRSNVYLI